jgi:hypothetical protein
MGGWFADILVGYFITLFRIVAPSLRACKSKGRHEITATVSGASLSIIILHATSCR